MFAMRAGCYARFSSDLQRETSLTDQIATARRYAAAHGWEFVEAQVYTDAAISGSSLERPGIQALRAAAQLQPRPFDVLLVDDSSRVSRDLDAWNRRVQLAEALDARVATNLKVGATSRAGDLSAGAWSVAAYNTWLSQQVSLPRPYSDTPTRICPYLPIADPSALPLPAEILVLDPDPKSVVLGTLP
jgi:DNA invertase Pin-like site-specific DNA recombinase